MIVVVRRIKKEDFAEWLRLRNALWPHLQAGEQEGEMAELLDHPDEMPVFVAERPEGGLCGLLEVAIRTEAEGCRTGRIGYLEGWYVDEDWRRMGVGRSLVAEAETWAREKGLTEMASDTTLDYPLSPAAHARLGYEEVNRTIHFRKELPEK